MIMIGLAKPDKHDFGYTELIRVQPLQHSSSSTPGFSTPGILDTSTPAEYEINQNKAEKEEDHGSAHSTPFVQTHVERPQTRIREVLFIFILCMANFMTLAGFGMALAPAHIIGRSFGIQNNGGELSWLIAAYSLTVGTFILIAGRLGDLFGHKKLFIGGFFWFGLWSLLAGFSVYSPSAKFFDCCRALQGVGASFLMPNALAILGRTYKPGEGKEMAFAAFGSVAPAGFIIGAIFSSLIAQDFWWPWSFWIMAITCFLCAFLAIFFLPYTPAPKFENDGVSIWERMDIIGSVLGVTGLVLFNFSWNQAPGVGWPTVYVYVVMIVGIITLALFFVAESRARFPLLPVEVLNRETGFILGCVGTGWASFSIWVYYLFQLQIVLRKESALTASTHLVPSILSGLAAAMMTGFLLSKISPSYIMIIALTAFTVGLIILATCPVKQIYWAQVFVSLLIMPWGMDMSFPAGTILLSNVMPKEHQGIAASLVNTVVNYSISIALGIAGTIETQVNEGGTNVLRGYRGALYFGIGLAGTGVLIAFLYVLHGFEMNFEVKKKVPRIATDDEEAGKKMLPDSTTDEEQQAKKMMSRPATEEEEQSKKLLPRSTTDQE